MLVQRFDPSSSLDTNGFFIAKFVVNRTTPQTISATDAPRGKAGEPTSLTPHVPGHHVVSAAASRGIPLHAASVALALTHIRRRRFNVPSLIPSAEQVQ